MALKSSRSGGRVPRADLWYCNTLIKECQCQSTLKSDVARSFRYGAIWTRGRPYAISGAISLLQRRVVLHGKASQTPEDPLGYFVSSPGLLIAGDSCCYTPDIAGELNYRYKWAVGWILTPYQPIGGSHLGDHSP